MLQSLIVKNYRNLSKLTIPRLGRVNLITGKNNSGKSSLLDAISIYACEGNISWLIQLLDDRKEFISNVRPPFDEGAFEKAVSCLFTNRALKEPIIIGEMESDLFSTESPSQYRVEIKPVKIIDEEVRRTSETNKEIIFSKQRRVLEENDIEYSSLINARLGFEIYSNSQTTIFETRDILRNTRFRDFPSNLQYVHTQNIDRETNSSLWDKVALSYKESLIIDALKIIEPNIERIAFVSTNESVSRLVRTPMVKLKGDDVIYPLKSMGDGINRILTIVLSLVNCENGYLLIDEVENGLHYSVQRLLWKVIFDVADKLEVQVFATTHSNDCIRAFGETVLDSHDYNYYSSFKTGQLLRLQQGPHNVEVIEYTSETLFSAIKFNIETR
ncbi:AAA family ATPase [Mucilaginibacter psychrotolerans]|uniref:Endonuclease GajA/Old nuclease/RecF-like AAA domain-containing protein n=1 Tax=Mucilaginibacter psychrotolerans TaxID=1524096 RepID=A0A4Y8SEW0_9SPHI|nr:ATP-binding protein [Mucilaginibacter psychrotolerans]TFF37145.1 hypothetical protein E2R66_13770 [Mucilaginibacter psychrotolerans]